MVAEEEKIFLSWIGCFSAANSAMSVASRSEAGTAFLVKLLDVLETASLDHSSSLEKMCKLSSFVVAVTM